MYEFAPFFLLQPSQTDHPSIGVAFLSNTSTNSSPATTPGGFLHQYFPERPRIPSGKKAKNPDGRAKTVSPSVKMAIFKDGDTENKASSLKTGVFRDEDLLGSRSGPVMGNL